MASEGADAVALPQAQRDVLLHALGLDQHEAPERGVSRDWTCAEAGDGAHEALARAGLLVACGAPSWMGGLVAYRVTARGQSVGLAIFRREEADKPRPSRSQQRYHAFLRSGARDCGLSFGAWLKGGYDRRSA